MAVELGKHGQHIWDSYEAAKLDAGSQALVRELARCADTLDRLDDLVSGRREVWAELVFDDMGEVHLSVDKLLDERRNHQLALKALLGELRMAGIKPSKNADQAGTSEGPEDMLTKRRREREERERKLG